jgi:hypothetical protein
MVVPRRGLANVPAPGYASDAAAPEPAAVDELTNINFTDVIHDKGHIKLPVFIYCVPGCVAFASSIQLLLVPRSGSHV